MNHFSQQLNMSHISQCKPLAALPTFVLSGLKALLGLKFG